MFRLYKNFGIFSEDLVENEKELTAIEHALAKAERTRKRFRGQVVAAVLLVMYLYSVHL